MKTILFLDGADLTSIPKILLLSRRKQIVVIDEKSLGNENRYLAPAGFLEFLEKFTATRDFDLIILGNNEKAGLAKAAVIHESKRPRTIIVSDGSLESGARHEYEKLGYTQFMTRIGLSDLLDAKLRF